MPLIKSTKKSAIGKNIATEVKAGKPVKQAAAIAYSEQREARKRTTSDGYMKSRVSEESLDKITKKSKVAKSRVNANE